MPASADHFLDLLEEIAYVACEHDPLATGGYGSAWWKPDTDGKGPVFWVSADWTTNDEEANAVRGFLALEYVTEVIVCAECAGPEGDGWQKAYPNAVTAALPARHEKATVPVEVHNRTLRRAYKAADALAPELVKVIQPILAKAGADAARKFLEGATNHLTAAATQADITSRSTMIAVYPRPDEAAAIAEDGGEAPEVLHVTLAYCGELDDNQADGLIRALAQVAGTHPPLEGHVGGVGAFDDMGNGAPAIALPDVRGLVELRQDAAKAIAQAEGVDYSRDHGYVPHMTVAYRDGGSAPPDRSILGKPLHFDELHVVQGNVKLASHPLTGAPSLTAAGTPDWTPPAMPELINVPALTKQILAKTEPVRKAFLEATMTPVLKASGLNFDVTNPLVSKALAESAKQVTSIAETTRENIQKSIAAGYKTGLSIPDTAKLIQAGSAESSATRATMIARTELTRAANSGSLAATSIVSQETGAAYTKVWMTAPGAQYPRHELVSDLDGQEVGLDEPFDVDGEDLMFPGDPDGSPEETINCRCSMSYNTGAGGEETVDAEDEPDMSALPTEGEADVGAEEGFDTSDLPEEAVAPVDAAEAAISSVVKIPNDIKITELPDSDAATARSLPSGDIGIHADSKPATLQTAVVHEYAHVMDRSIMGTEDEWATQTDALHPLYQTITDSPTVQAIKGDQIKILEGDTATRNQLLQGRELFARAFEQYIAVESGDPVLLANIEKIVSDPLLGFQYWKPEEFKPIAEQMTKILRDKGLLREPEAISATQDAGAGGNAIVLPNNRFAAADQMMYGVEQGARLKGADFTSEDFAKGKANWERIFRGNIETDKAHLGAVKDADAYNMTSAVHQAQVDKYGRDAAIVVRPVKPGSPIYFRGAAERMSGNRVTLISNDESNFDGVREAIKPGDGTTGSGGLSATLRHEYGHQIYDSLTASQKERLGADLPDQATVKRDLTIYGSGGLDVGNTQEAFCELYAVVSDPAYDPSAWASWVRQLGHEYFDAPLTEGEAKVAPVIAPEVERAVVAPLGTGTLAADLARIKDSTTWLTDEEDIAKQGPAAYNPNRGLAGPESWQISTLAKEQFAATLDAGVRIRQEMQIDSTFSARITDAEARVERVSAERDAKVKELADAQRAARSAWNVAEKIQENNLALERYGKVYDQLEYAEKAQLQLDPRLVTPEIEQLKKAYYDAIDVMGSYTSPSGPGYAPVKEANAALAALRSDQAIQFRDEALRVLSQARAMGPSGDNQLKWGTIGSKARSGVKKAQGLINEAQQRLPADWLGRVKPIDAGTTKGRGAQWNYPSNSKINLGGRGGPIQSDAPGAPTAIHEVGHAIEDSNPLIVQQEQSFYQWRTRGGSFTAPMESPQKLQKLFPGYGYGRDETARTDKFVEVYMGKYYSGGRNFELLTVGLESVFNGTNVLDEEYMNWMLGVLALI